MGGLEIPEGVTNDASLGFDYWSLLAISVVECVFGLLYAIYRYANYTHPRDIEFGRGKLAKISVIIGIFLWILPTLYVPLDVLLSSHSDLSR